MNPAPPPQLPPQPHPPLRPAERAAWIAAGLLALAPAFVLAGAGWFSRPVTDDFCMAARVRADGLAGAWLFWRENWTGRHASILAVSLVSLAGTGAGSLLPGLLIAAWFAAGWAAVRAWRPERGAAPPLAADWLPAAAMAAPLAAAPDVYQSFLWRTGSLTYAPPLILWTWMAALLGGWRLAPAPGPARRALRLAGAFALAFAAGGFNEPASVVNAALAFAVIAAASLGAAGSPGERLRPEARALLAGALASAAAVVLAPGNAVRAASTPPEPALQEVPALAREQFLYFAGKEILRAGPPVAAGALLAALWMARFGAADSEGRARFRAGAAAGGLAAAFALAFLALAASAAAMRHYPPPRALLTHHALMAGAGVFAGAALLLPAAARLARAAGPGALAALALLAAGFPAVRAVRMAAHGPAMAAWAKSWDERDARLRRIPAEEGWIIAEVPAIAAPPGLSDLGDEEWAARCAAEYYGLAAIHSPPSKEHPRWFGMDPVMPPRPEKKAGTRGENPGRAAKDAGKRNRP